MKPFVEITSPSGITLSAIAPPDHPWHRGLWFAIKYVNGINFWEEPADEPFGQQEADGDLVHWICPDGTTAIEERRSVEGVELDDDSFGIDWSAALTAVAATELERTPYTTWGGYGGLAFRGSPGWTDTRLLLADGSIHRRPEGVPSPWCDLSSADAGITFMDHPENPRHPVPWYGATRSRVYGEGWSNFINAALLFHEGMHMDAGETLTLRYRVVVHDGMWDQARGDAAWRDWTNR